MHYFRETCDYTAKKFQRSGTIYPIPSLQKILRLKSRTMTFNEAPTLGIQDFMEMIDDNYPEWAILAVKATVEDIGSCLTGFAETSNWVRNIPILVSDLDSDDLSDWKAVVQIKQSEWSIVYRLLFDFSNDVTDWAIHLSKALGTEVITFTGEETGGDIGYRLVRVGEVLEECSYSGDSRYDFYSQLRSQPHLDLLDEKANDATYADGYTYNLKQHLAFINQMFSEQGIYIPACYPQNNNGNFRLAVSEPSFARIERADLVGVD